MRSPGFFTIAIFSLLAFRCSNVCTFILMFSPLLSVNGAELEGFGDDSESDADMDALDHAYLVTDDGAVAPSETVVLDGGGSDTRSADPPPESTVTEPLLPPSSTWEDEEFEAVDAAQIQGGIADSASAGGQADRRYNLQEILRKEEDVKAKKIAEKEERKRKKREIMAARALESQTWTPVRIIELSLEITLAVFLISYGINYWLGCERNNAIALSFAEQFCSAGGIIHRNFSHVGIGSQSAEDGPLIVQEGGDRYKFYASGRRYCQGIVGSLELKSRHDLLSVLWNILVPSSDVIVLQVLMNEEAMDPFVLAVVKRKQVKSFQKENKDLKDLAAVVDLSGRKRWPADEVAVISDSKDAVLEILSDAVEDQLFGEKVFKKQVADWFVSLHFTDQCQSGSHKKVLSFKFKLPEAKDMSQLSRLMASVPHFIDAVGRFRLAAQVRSKAELTRSKWIEEDKETQDQRVEAALKKKEEKRKAEEAKLSAAELARKHEKERIKAMKKAMPRMKLTKAH